MIEACVVCRAPGGGESCGACAAAYCVRCRGARDACLVCQCPLPPVSRGSRSAWPLVILGGVGMLSAVGLLANVMVPPPRHPIRQLDPATVRRRAPATVDATGQIWIGGPREGILSLARPVRVLLVQLTIDRGRSTPGSGSLAEPPDILEVHPWVRRAGGPWRSITRKLTVRHHQPWLRLESDGPFDAARFDINPARQVTWTTGAGLLDRPPGEFLTARETRVVEWRPDVVRVRLPGGEVVSVSTALLRRTRRGASRVLIDPTGRVALRRAHDGTLHGVDFDHGVMAMNVGKARAERSPVPSDSPFDPWIGTIASWALLMEWPGSSSVQHRWSPHLGLYADQDASGVISVTAPSRTAVHAVFDGCEDLQRALSGEPDSSYADLAAHVPRERQVVLQQWIGEVLAQFRTHDPAAAHPLPGDRVSVTRWAHGPPWPEDSSFSVETVDEMLVTGRTSTYKQVELPRALFLAKPPPKAGENYSVEWESAPR